MARVGSYHVKVLEDGFGTAITADHSEACHFEHPIVITAKEGDGLVLGC